MPVDPHPQLPPIVVEGCLLFETTAEKVDGTLAEVVPHCGQLASLTRLNPDKSSNRQLQEVQKYSCSGI